MGWAPVALVLVLGGCASRAAPPPPRDAAPVARPIDRPRADAGPPPIEAFATAGDEPAALAAAGAWPAWAAVNHRAELLARRGDRGAVYGRVVRAGDDAFLVDETAGQGALGIRIGWPRGVALAAGTRAILWGGWALDRARRWQWATARVATLAGVGPGDAAAASGAAAPSDAPPPSHALGDGDAEGAIPPSALLALAGKGAPVRVAFAVTAPPLRAGDGWAVADEPGGTAVAVLVLPGEQPIYGGQDYLADDERWPLVPGQRYVAVVAPRRLRTIRADLPSFAVPGSPWRAPAPPRRP